MWGVGLCSNNLESIVYCIDTEDVLYGIIKS